MTFSVTDFGWHAYGRGPSASSRSASPSSSSPASCRPHWNQPAPRTSPPLHDNLTATARPDRRHVRLDAAAALLYRGVRRDAKIEGHPAPAPIQFGGAVILTAFFQIISCSGCSELPSRDHPRDHPRFQRLRMAGLDHAHPHRTQCNSSAWRSPDSWTPGITPSGPAGRPPNIWVAVIGAGGVLAVYMKTGPFSWNGIIGSGYPSPCSPSECQSIHGCCCAARSSNSRTPPQSRRR